MRRWRSSWMWFAVAVAALGGAAVGFFLSLSPTNEAALARAFIDGDSDGFSLFTLSYMLAGACVGLAMLAGPFVVATAFQTRALLWETQLKSRDELRKTIEELARRSLLRRPIAALSEIEYPSDPDHPTKPEEKER